MKNINISENATVQYDVVICGGGIAGLWLLNILISKGFSVLLVEKFALGGVQTMASQGMIHGGQRYLLGANSSIHAESVALLPDRWEACLQGVGEIDLRGVRVLSETQLMWPTGGRLTYLALNAASRTFNTKMRKIDLSEVPVALADLTNRPVYELPEKVLDITSLVDVLSSPHRGHIVKGSVNSLTRDGRLTVDGLSIATQAIVCSAGLGNEEFLELLEAGTHLTQRRPIRQVMVKSMPFPLYGHGVTTSHKPRITVSSHPLPSGGYVWYLGGALADDVLSLTDDEAIAYAKKEMSSLFKHLDWSQKQWSTWFGTRAEAYCSTGRLPSGPIIQEYDNVLVVWPTKLTLTPLLGDQVLVELAERGVRPKHSVPTSSLLSLPQPLVQATPWEQAAWKR